MCVQAVVLMIEKSIPFSAGQRHLLQQFWELFTASKVKELQSCQQHLTG